MKPTDCSADVSDLMMSAAVLSQSFVCRGRESTPTIRSGTQSHVESVSVIRGWCSVRMWVTAGPRGSQRASAALCA